VYKILSKLVDECWRYSKPKQCHFWAWLQRPIFGVHDSQGSAETLVNRGGITNYHLLAYSFSNISAKNYQNRLMCVEVIAWNVIVVFFETQCSDIRGAIKSCIYKALSHSVSECQSDESAEFAIFSQNRLPWQRPLRYRKKRSISIIWCIVKIGPVDPEIIVLRKMIKKDKKRKTIMQAKYVDRSATFLADLMIKTAVYLLR